MQRESVFLCTYSGATHELVGHVRAWDDREAAALFARELELDFEEGAVPPADIRVQCVVRGDGTAGGGI